MNRRYSNEEIDRSLRIVAGEGWANAKQRKAIDDDRCENCGALLILEDRKSHRCNPVPAQNGGDYVDDDDHRAAGVEFAPRQATHGWLKPKAMPTGLLPVDPFNLDFIPDALRRWIEDVANRLQCPPDYVAVAAITALGSVIGRRIGIKPQRKTDWIETPNLWGLFIGRPGMLKSPAMMEALKPIHWLEAECAKANQAAQDEYVAELNAFKLRKEVAISLKKKELKKSIVDLNTFKRLAEEAAAEIDLEHFPERLNRGFP